METPSRLALPAGLVAYANSATAQVSESVPWQNRSGQVHSWPMQKGRNMGGVNVSTPVSGNWLLVGASDLY